MTTSSSNSLIWPARPERCLVIGEVAQAHDGSLGMAHAYIDAIAAAGADAVKFQTHIAHAESTPSEPWRVKFSLQDETRYAYWQRMEFTPEQWAGLKQHASDKNLLFLSSPFSLAAVDLLTRVGVAAWKIASGEVSNLAMFESMAKTGLPLLISSGMNPWAELDAAVALMRQRRLPFGLFQCTSAYPCPPEKVGLNLLSEFRQRYDCPVGLSDHSGTIFAGLAAATLGIEMLEVHVTFSREMFGPDVVASVTTAELRQLVEGIRFIERMRANPVDKDAMAQSLAPLRGLFTKSIVAACDLPRGTLLTEQHLMLKKPGSGLPPSRWNDVVGRTLKRDLSADTLIEENDFE